jgi:hypothetical protein
MGAAYDYLSGNQIRGQSVFDPWLNALHPSSFCLHPFPLAVFCC